ncbi:XrtA system polysaccharide chain length determinant [Thermodesulfobacteriota bacterium]
MNSLDITKYIDMALRQKYWIIVPFLLVVLGGFNYFLITPRIYEARTLILVQPQKVPQDFVRTIVSSDIEDRMRTITQQVTSRTNLENIIKEYGLFNKPNQTNLFLEDKVSSLKRRININVATMRGQGGSAFSISFQGNDPNKVMQVTNALASNFISENLRIRESQAQGTSAFLLDELESITRRLIKKEEQLKEYRLKHMGSLPDQLATNLNISSRLQMQLEQMSSNLRDAENRKLIIQQQITDSEMLRRDVSQRRAELTSSLATPSATLQEEGSEEILELERQLALLEGRYTANHPDVIRLKQMIANLQSKETTSEHEGDSAETGESSTSTGVHDTGQADDRALDHLRRNQLQQIDLEIKNLRTEIENVQSRVKAYQRRIEETPKREQELISINRDYENNRELYNSMLTRQLEAEIAVSMEKKQKGEQFRVIDSAKIPQRPISPDTRKIMLMTLALGLGLGGGLAYLLEFMDTSFKTPQEVELDLGLPILMSMPIRYTVSEVKRKKIKGTLIMMSIGMGFLLSVFAIVLRTKGMHATMDYVKTIIEKI